MSTHRPTTLGASRALLLCTALVAAAFAGETALRLDDGSVLRGRIAGETDGIVALETPWGTLQIPAGDIRTRQEWKNPVVVDERWVFADATGDARVVVRSAPVPAGAGESFAIPVEGRVTDVTEADGAKAQWTHVPAGPLSIVTVGLDGIAEGECFDIEAAVPNPLKSEDGAMAFTRTYTPDAAGLLRVEFDVPAGWTASFPMGACDVARIGDRIVVRRELRKQERFELRVEFIVPSAE